MTCLNEDELVAVTSPEFLLTPQFDRRTRNFRHGSYSKLSLSACLYFKGMRNALLGLLAAASIGSMAVPAHACRMYLPHNADDIRSADAVVIGRVSNYRLVLDPEARANWAKQYAPREMPDGFISDYALFDVTVDEVLAGNPPRKFTISWNNSTFGEPKTMAAGPFLIGLRRLGSPQPLRGPSGMTAPPPREVLFTLLQEPCSSPFMFESGSEEAAAARRLLETPAKIENR